MKNLGRIWSVCPAITVFLCLVIFATTALAKGDKSGEPPTQNTRAPFYGVADKLNLNYELNVRSTLLDRDFHTFVHGAAIGGSYYFQKESGDLASFHFFTGIGEKPESRRFLSHYGDYYLIVNGPKGKVNLKLGRYNLPFGLISTFDSHRRLTQGFYNISLGMRKDTGISLFGYFKDYVYEVSYTNGSGRLKFKPSSTQLLTARIGGEAPNLTYGFSVASGLAPEGTHELITDVNKPMALTAKVNKNFVNLDATYDFDAFSLIGEAVYGQEHGFFHHGIFGALDYRTSKSTLFTVSTGIFKSGWEQEVQQFVAIETAYLPSSHVDLRGQLLYFKSEEEGASHAGSMFTISVAWRY